MTPCHFRISLDNLFHFSGLGFLVKMTPFLQIPNFPLLFLNEASPAGVVSYVQMDETGPTKATKDQIPNLVKNLGGSWY